VLFNKFSNFHIHLFAALVIILLILKYFVTKFLSYWYGYGIIAFIQTRNKIISNLPVSSPIIWWNVYLCPSFMSLVKWHYKYSHRR